MWPESPIPGHNCTQSSQGEPNEATHQGVPHGPVRREPRRDVAARDGVNGAINGREREEGIRHPLVQRRKDPGLVQRQVGAE